MSDARRLIEEELRDRLDGPPVNLIWLALHIGCAANALGINGPIEPAPAIGGKDTETSHGG